MKNPEIEKLEPKLLWNYFAEISEIPRPSKKEEKIREYLIDFAKKNNLNFVEDSTGNIVIYVPATKGYENVPTIVLQGHIDMVCEKNGDKVHDFEKDPISLVVDNGWVRADKTTLGADNGIGVAAGLAIAVDTESVHGPIEILCTVDEETGLTGANGLATDLLKGKYLLNLDGEGDGVFFIGCSGGLDTVCYLDLKKEKNTYDTSARLFVTGLVGGHSGVDIHLGRGNSIKVLSRFLSFIKDIDYSISFVAGGSLRNAIPREAETVISYNKKDEANILSLLSSFLKDIKIEFEITEPNLNIQFSNCEPATEVFTKDLSTRLLKSLLAMPHGVIAMSQAIEGLVETSTNLATLTLLEDKIRIGTSQRSSLELAKIYVSEMVQSAITLADGTFTINDGYPGWQPDINSSLLKKIKEVYKREFGEEPEIKAIHAGLECGILGGKYPGMEMISFGPTILGAHSPDEKVNIADVEKFYKLLKDILKEFTK